MEAVMADDHTAVLTRITGKVQGVNFRAWTRQEAQKLGLTGWVRNETDGSVTALIAGSETAVSKMLEAFWRGPPAASISNVSRQPIDAHQTPSSFTITG
jgi:acylphosphatase